MRKFSLIGCLLAAVPLNAQANIELNYRSVIKLGSQGAGGYFTVEGALSASCKYDVIYFSGANYQSILLAAKFAGKKLSRINYAVDGEGRCHLGLVEVE